MLSIRRFPFGEKKLTEKEIKQLKDKIASHKGISQEISKVHDQKKVIFNLFCSHKKVVRRGDIVICTKCGYKWKVNYSTGTSKINVNKVKK